MSEQTKQERINQLEAELAELKSSQEPTTVGIEIIKGVPLKLDNEYKEVVSITTHTSDCRTDTKHLYYPMGSEIVIKTNGVEDRLLEMTDGIVFVLPHNADIDPSRIEFPSIEIVSKLKIN